MNSKVCQAPCQAVLLLICFITGSCGQLCQFDDGFCGWFASGDLAWDINYVADSENKVYVAEVRIPDWYANTAFNANTGLTKLISPTHRGSPTIKDSTLSFSYLIRGQGSLSVEAELGGTDVVELWSSKRLPRELDSRWKKAEVSVPESEAFVVSFLAEVQPGPDAFLGITNVSLVVGDKDECVDKPCNDGICVDGDGYYTCLCTGGYRGTQCQIPPRIITKARLASLQAIETTVGQTTVETSDMTTPADVATTADLAGTTWFETTAYTEIITSEFTTQEIQTTSAVETTEHFETTPSPATDALTVLEETTWETTAASMTGGITFATTADVLTEGTTLEPSPVPLTMLTELETSPEVTTDKSFTTDEVTEELTTEALTTSNIVEPRTTEKPTTVKVPITERTTFVRTETYPTEKPQQQLSAGEIAGIVIGSLLFFVVCSLFVLYVILYKRRHKAYNLDYFDEEFIMEYVNRKPQQRYTGYWKSSASHAQDLNRNAHDSDGNKGSIRANNVNTPYQINNAMTMEEDSTREETYSEGDHDTTREDETAFRNYDTDFTGEDRNVGRSERFI